MVTSQPVVQLGIDACLSEAPAVLRGSRFGLLMNQASVNQQLRYTCDLLADRFPGRLAALFSPQHGLWCEQQDNMIETPHAVYRPLDIPLYSLYSETRKPTPEMLAGLECLVIDLQDVGTRVYTFVWTAAYCLQACAEAGIPVLVLDRPNPLGGVVVEGPLLDSTFRSFVGLAPIPMRHGLTLGELLQWMNCEQGIDAELQIVPMNGWRREMQWHETGLVWLAPSPNMPRFETALLYPGQVLLEGTNLSEGRGTTAPFEIAGAGYIDQDQLIEQLAKFETPGLALRPIRFRPTFNKWAEQSCGGVAFSVVSPQSVRSYAVTLALLGSASSLWPDDFALTAPPYEYETEKLPLDILSGSDQLSGRLRRGPPMTVSEIAELAAVDQRVWHQRTAEFQLYEHEGGQIRF